MFTIIDGENYTDNQNKIILTNIQRCSFQDGPGIRTTVFLKGCLLKCPWCCNPENISDKPQKYIKDGKKKTYGKYYSQEKLLQEILRDVDFYGNYFSSDEMLTLGEIEKIEGGVTFSGGEPLLQIDKIIGTINELRRKKIHTAIETSLFAPLDKLNIALNYIDLFLVDFKVLNYEKCKEYIKGDIHLFLSNLAVLLKSRRIIARIPIIEGYTATEENIRDIAELINNYSDQIIEVELLKGHNLGKTKYDSLCVFYSDIKCTVYHEVSDETLEKYRNLIIVVTQGKVPVVVRKI